MKTLRLGRLIVIAVLIGVVATGWYMFSRGFSARLSPNRIESFIAPRLRNLAIPATARDAKNPIADSPEVLSAAMEHFADHCAFCHGSEGAGKTHIGEGMFPKPPDMRLGATQNLTDGEIYYIIENGVRYTGMPAFGDASGNEQDEDSWKLVMFIRHIPNLTPEQIQQVDQMTPKSPMEQKQDEDIQKFLQGDDNPTSHENHKHH
jgi:mono/diheme cytochrome c family protein